MVNLYVEITAYDWYRFLMARPNIEEVNFRLLGFDQTVPIFVAHHQQAISAAWAKLSACQHGAAARNTLSGSPRFLSAASPHLSR